MIGKKKLKSKIGKKIFNYEMYPTKEIGKYVFKILDAESGKVLAWSKLITDKKECLGMLEDLLGKNPDRKEKAFKYEVHKTRMKRRYIFRIWEAGELRLIAWSKQFKTQEKCTGIVKGILRKNQGDIHVYDVETGEQVKLGN